MTHNLTIGQVAKKIGISRDAVRIYEREGLIEKPKRTPNGYRIYSEDILRRLHFIQRAKNMGFTLKEIGELLAIKRHRKDTCEKIRSRAESKLIIIERKIAELNQLKKALDSLIRTCNHSGKMSECPILEAMEDQKEDVKL